MCATKAEMSRREQSFINKAKLPSLLMLYISLALRLMVLAPVQNENVKTISALKSSQSKQNEESRDGDRQEEGVQTQR